MSKRKADDIEVVAFDARDVTAGAALNSVGAGFVVRLIGCEIAGDFFARELREVDLRGLDEAAALGVGETDERDAGENGVCSAGKLFEDVARVVGGARLAEDAIVESNDRVGGDNNSWTDSTGGNEFGFCVGEALDESGGRFVGGRCFIDCGGHDRERIPRVMKDFSATRGGGGENEFH